MITAQSADGTQHQFPDGTADSVIDGVMKDYASKAAPAPNSGIGSFLRGAANGATFNLADTIAAAGDATIPLDSGASKAPTWAQRFQENRGLQKGQTASDHAAHPGAAISGDIAGGFLNPITRVLPVAKTLGGAIGQGAGVGAGYGLGGGISNQDDASGIAGDVVKGATIGAAIPAALPALGGVARAGGKLASNALGLTTGVGAKPIEQAFQAGAAGGDQATAFASNMRGDTPWSDVVAQAKTALGNMRAQKAADYRSGMADISKDSTVLSFDPLDKAMADAGKVKTFKGQDLSPSTADVRTEIQSKIDDWKKLDPAEYHTPEGFDALKQQIGDIKDSQPFGSPQRNVANTAYGAIRKTIADQAPGYDKVMSGYSQASDAVDAIQKELSLGPKGNPGTAMRKLQSVMRDNVNTSYGNRATYADALKGAGADTLMPSLAGKSMSSLLPRGLGRLLGGAEVAGAVAAPGLVLKTGGLLAASSPRLVGEAALGLGRGVGALRSLPRITGLSSAAVRNALSAPTIAGLTPSMLPRLPN